MYSVAYRSTAAAAMYSVIFLSITTVGDMYLRDIESDGDAAYQFLNAQLTVGKNYCFYTSSPVY